MAGHALVPTGSNLPYSVNCALLIGPWWRKLFQRAVQNFPLSPLGKSNFSVICSLRALPRSKFRACFPGSAAMGKPSKFPPDPCKNRLARPGGFQMGRAQTAGTLPTICLPGPLLEQANYIASIYLTSLARKNGSPLETHQCSLFLPKGRLRRLCYE